MVVALPTTPLCCLLRLLSSHPTPGRPSRLPLFRRRSPFQPYTLILHRFSILIPAQIRDSFQWRYFSPAGRLDRVETFAGSSGYHPRGQSPFRKQSRASPICGRRCSSSKTRASKRGFRCCSIRDCADSSIRGIKRSAAGFSSGSSTAPWLGVSPSWPLNAAL